MPGFEKQETAARMRNIIKGMSDRRISVAVPGPLIGRVITLDLPKLQATVWFPGDAQPVGVSLFSGLIPGTWQEQNSFGDSSSTAGYGSMVVCEPFRGVLYITQVLTGGQFSYNHKALNFSIMSSEENNSASGLQFAYATESFLNVSIAEELNYGEAAVFGPFVILADAGFGGFDMSWFEINTSEQRGSRSFKFNLDSYTNFLDDAPGTGGQFSRWLRLIPHQEMTTDYIGDSRQYHLDVGVFQTQYGVDFSDFQYNEVWFRIVSETSGLNPAAMDISVRSGLLHQTGAVNGNRSLVSYVDPAPALIKGYAGFHNSRFTKFDLDDSSWRDRFNRTLSGSWGGFSDSPDVYTTAGGTGSNYAVDGANGTITPTATAQLYRAFSNRTKTDFDFYCRFQVSQLATGSFYEIGFPVRQSSTSNWYAFWVTVNTSNSMDIQVKKMVGGVESTVGAAVTGVGTLAINTSWMMRGQLRGNELRMKLWLASATEPVAWNLGPLTDASHTGSGSVGCLVRRNTGNTSNSLVVRFEELTCYTNPTMPDNPNENSWSTGPYRSGLLRVADLLQRTWVPDGQFTWDGTNIKWTGKIWFTGIGAHPQGLVDGLTGVSCPTASYSIPVIGGTTGNTLATMTTSGIPLAAGQSLWCAIPPGVRELDLMHNLFIVDSPRGGASVNLPEWAVLIAQRQPSSAAAGAIPIRLGNGDWLDKWHAVGTAGEPAFVTNWTNTNVGNYTRVAFRKKDPNTVELQGLATYSTTTNPGIAMFTLPTGYTPPVAIEINKATHPAATTLPSTRTIAIATSGVVSVTHFPNATNPGPIDLNSILFSLTAP